ncbi:hypothetical protein ACPEEZ_11520 [Frigoribacterium sp. 2-23]|uniref:hypothetical protein n=1 Tax=Frigoribacterium sp. 2-23 TaxID=3415006 RepID=UPI003C6F2A61
MSSRWHLVWAIPGGLLAGLTGFVVGFYPWCGTEQCAVFDPGRYALQTFAAFLITLVGGSAGGAVTVLAPWSSRRRHRLRLAVGVAALPVAFALWYAVHFTAR